LKCWYENIPSGNSANNRATIGEKTRKFWFQASGELCGGFTTLIDPKKNKYEEASQVSHSGVSRPTSEAGF
jgi:hypothetical protein